MREEVAIPHPRYFIRDALRRLRVKLGLKRAAQDEVAARPPVRDAVRYGDVALRDAVKGGWFLNDTRELMEGFRIDPSDTVIDVGCGIGLNLRFCAKFAAHAIGVDVDPARVEAAARGLREAGVSSFQTIVSDGNPLPIESASIDKIVCTEVLEHVEDPAVSMRELVRIGRPGALYLISVPDALCEQVQKNLAPKSYFERPNHIRVFSRDDFQKLVKDAGLVIERHGFSSFYWAVWHAIVWQCDIDYDNGTHPALDHWARAWDEVLRLPGGQKCKDALDEAMPKSQFIIARKPG